MTGVLGALSVAAALLINAVPCFAGTVNVSFIHPENFADASLQEGYRTRAEQGTLDEIGRFFESLGPRYLKSQQVLTLDVLNVDLAGKIEWWRKGFFRHQNTPRRLSAPIYLELPLVRGRTDFGRKQGDGCRPQLPG